MITNLISNSVVIIANSHNPTLISPDFFKRIGIIQNEEEIVKENYLVNIAGSQVFFQNGTRLFVNSERLELDSTDNEDPFGKAQKYCNELPHIKLKAIGTNFWYRIEEVSLDEWFKRYDFGNGITCNGIDFVKQYVNSLCYIKIIPKADKNEYIEVTFNFHYKYNEDSSTLKDIKMDFLKEREQNIKESNKLIETFFK